MTLSIIVVDKMCLESFMVIWLPISFTGTLKHRQHVGRGSKCVLMECSPLTDEDIEMYSLGNGSLQKNS